MRALVTGGAGFLGHHFIEHFLKHTDAQICVVDKLNYASMGFDRLRDIGCFDDSRVHRFVHDITLPIVAGLAYELGPITHIFHIAAETHVDNSIKDPRPFVRSNVLGTMEMLEYAKTLPTLEGFYYFSTDEVFGPALVGDHMEFYDGEWPEPAPDLRRFPEYSEWHRYNSTNPYSATKAGAEELCLAWANTYGLPVVITHCMNLFGERQHVEKFIPGTIRKVIHGELVAIHSDSTRQRSGSRFYLHARNAADAVLFLLSHADRREKYNIVGQAECSNLELAKFIAEVVGNPLNYEMVDFHSSRPGHDLRYALDGSKLKLLGWKPPVEFGPSLEKTIRWYLANPKWLGEYIPIKDNINGWWCGHA